MAQDHAGVSTQAGKGRNSQFTPDWTAARTSVEKLAALDPDLVITGDGQPMGWPGDV